MLGVIAIILGVLFENQNIAFMVGGICYRRELQLPHHSAFHVLVKTDHARRYAGRLVRFTDSGGADDSWPYHLGADPRPRKAIFPYEYPALFSISVAFTGIWFFSATDNSAEGNREREQFRAQFIRSQTGFGVQQGRAH